MGGGGGGGGNIKLGAYQSPFTEKKKSAKSPPSLRSYRSQIVQKILQKGAWHFNVEELLARY